MNTNTENKTLTKNQIAYQKAKAKKGKTKLMVDYDEEKVKEEKVEERSVDKESDDEESVDKESVDKESDDEESVDKESDDEKAIFKHKIKVYEAKIKALDEKKARKEAKANINELRNELRAYQQDLIDQATKQLLHLQQQIKQIDTGIFDEELITKHISETSKYAHKSKGDVLQLYKGKPAGTGDERARIITNLNSGKTERVKYAKKVGNNTWSLMYEERKDGGVAIMKDSEGVYSVPLFNTIGKYIGVSLKSKKDYAEWLKK
jgi:hypothetical protein